MQLIAPKMQLIAPILLQIALRTAAGLTYSPKLLFWDEDPLSDGITPSPALWDAMDDKKCAAAFSNMYSNLRIQQVWATVSFDDPCEVCQGGSQNSHCCQTWEPRPTALDATGGTCGCNAQVSGLALLLKMCATFQGRFATIDGSFTGMYGEGYVYHRRNLTVTCVPNPSVHCPAEGVESFLRALAGHCVVFNQRLQKDARCEFSMGGGFMLQGKDGVLRKLVGAAGNAAAAGAAPNSAVAALTWAMAVVLAQRTL